MRALSTAHDVTVAESHRLLPIWIVPLLTLILVLWTSPLVALTKGRRSRESQRDPSAQGTCLVVSAARCLPHHTILLP